MALPMDPTSIIRRLYSPGSYTDGRYDASNGSSHVADPSRAGWNYGPYMGGGAMRPGGPNHAVLYGQANNMWTGPMPQGGGFAPGFWPSQYGNPTQSPVASAGSRGLATSTMAPGGWDAYNNQRAQVGNLTERWRNYNNQRAQVGNLTEPWRNYTNQASQIGSMVPQASGINPFSAIKDLMPSADAGSMAGTPGTLSKIASFAKNFKPLSSGGNTIGGLLGNSKAFSVGGKLAGIGAAPAWSLPVAGLAIGGGLAYLNKRSKQKKQQNWMNSQRDLIKQANASGQYLTGGLGNFGPAKPY